MENLLRNLFRIPSGARVLDIGCGKGDMVLKLRSSGYEAQGTDFAESLPNPCPDYFLPIQAATFYDSRRSYKVISSYQLPFEDGVFAAVVSTSVLEHVLDKESFFREVKRVLAPNGILISSFPGSKYLPLETHIKVPLVNFLWPRVPQWWLALWAIIGVRTTSQQGMPWQKVYQSNLDYCRNSLSYWPVRKYRKLLVKSGFHDFHCGTVDHLEHMDGGYAALLRRFRVPWVIRKAFCDVRDVTISAIKD